MLEIASQYLLHVDLPMMMVWLAFAVAVLTTSDLQKFLHSVIIHCGEYCTDVAGGTVDVGDCGCGSSCVKTMVESLSGATSPDTSLPDKASNCGGDTASEDTSAAGTASLTGSDAWATEDRTLAIL